MEKRKGHLWPLATPHGPSHSSKRCRLGIRLLGRSILGKMPWVTAWVLKQLVAIAWTNQHVTVPATIFVQGANRGCHISDFHRQRIPRHQRETRLHITGQAAWDDGENYYGKAAIKHHLSACLENNPQFLCVFHVFSISVFLGSPFGNLNYNATLSLEI